MLVTKRRKVNIAVEQSSVPQIQLKMMEPNVCFFCMKLDFPTFTDFSRQRIRCTMASISKQKTSFQRLLFFWGKSAFPIGYAFFSISITKMYRRIFCGISAVITAFRQKRRSMSILNRSSTITAHRQFSEDQRQYQRNNRQS